MTASDKLFTGSIPALYDRYLGPLLFAPFAADMARRVAEGSPARVLETAAGTGIVTAALARRLPASTTITATDLNQTMLDVAAAHVTSRAIAWKACDATAMPFDAGGFDCVVCQFGVMFFPDKAKGFREARRVLRPGGRFLFYVWDSLASNPLPRMVVEAVAAEFPADPPSFLARTPHGYFDVPAITQSLAAAGFREIVSEAVTLPSRALSVGDVATGYCQGTPMRAEIEARAPSRLEAVTDIAAAALAKQFGTGPVESTMRAVVFSAVA